MPLSPLPTAPSWTLDWDELNRRESWLSELKDCPQDPVHHAEGDVWTHTRMVLEALTASERWRQLPEAARSVTFAAAALHDIGKPATTVREAEGRISSRGHSKVGERWVREQLWRRGVDTRTREMICNLVLFHQSPFFLLEREGAQRQAFLLSQVLRCDWLSLLTEADARGRRCEDLDALLDRVALFREYCTEQECLDAPRRFPSAHSRFEYFRKEDRDPNYHAHEDFSCTVTVLSGLPGAGKDHWITTHAPDLPCISLDRIRAERGISPRASQGAVVMAAKETAREHLRAGRDFVWNATNLSRSIRGQVVDLCARYSARIRLVYVECNAAELFERNKRDRDGIPRKALDTLLRKWEVPAPHEAHEVSWVVDSEAIAR